MKILKWLISSIIGIVLLLLAVIYFLPGYNLSVVRSDSMNPVFYAGDMLLTVPPDSFLGEEIKEGSIVTYDSGDELVTHRVVSIDQGMLITKGDASEEVDARPVDITQVRGVYCFRIPQVGHFTSFIRTKTGWFLVIILPAVLLVGLIIKDIIKESLRADKSAKKTVNTEMALKSSEKE